MQALFQTTRWSAAALLALSAAGCVKVTTEPAPTPFHCPADGQVPVQQGSSWSCVAPDALQVSALTAVHAGSALDAGTATFATHAQHADVADGLVSGSATLELTSSPPSKGPVQIDAPFHIQGFPVPSRAIVQVLRSYLTLSSETIGTIPLPVPPDAKLRFRIDGKVFSQGPATAPARCDVVVKGITGESSVVLAQLAVSASTLGTAVHLERTVNPVEQLEVSISGVAGIAQCDSSAGQGSDSGHDLWATVEVIR